MPTSDRLIVFARIPEAGQVKTRLIPTLGPDGAAKLHHRLTSRALRTGRDLNERHRAAIEVWYSGGEERQAQELVGSLACEQIAQQGADLGERLKHAVASAFDRDAQRVVVIGTDCPDISAEVLSSAYAALDEADVVLGPAFDGGYYLIGLGRNVPELFDAIDWGTERVLQQTQAICRHRRLRTKLLVALPDVDNAEDLIVCRRFEPEFREVLAAIQPGRISVVIPTLNEERVLERTIEAVSYDDSVEVIVSDGGSTDATLDIARKLGARIVSANRGRGRQLNAGAAFASGDTLLFLHADSRLPANFASAVRSALDAGCVAGAFRLKIDSPRRSLRWVESAVNARSRLLQRPYGDQALFVRSKLFFEIGGFPNWPLMEDVELCRRLRRRGRIGLTRESVTTSARRWEKLGVFRTTVVNQLTLLGFHVGVSPDRLARWYSGRKRRSRS